MESKQPLEAENPELLPGEETEIPDPNAVPQTVTTDAAFGGQAPLRKDEKNTGNQREAGA